MQLSALDWGRHTCSRFRPLSQAVETNDMSSRARGNKICEQNMSQRKAAARSTNERPMRPMHIWALICEIKSKTGRRGPFCLIPGGEGDSFHYAANPVWIGLPLSDDSFTHIATPGARQQQISRRMSSPFNATRHYQPHCSHPTITREDSTIAWQQFLNLYREIACMWNIRQ